MPVFQTYILAATATTTALMAGLFYAYSCSVVPGLGRLADAEYLAAMQSINRAILNPVFFIAFMGTPLLLPLITWMHYSQPVSLRFWLLLAATAVYLTGVVGVTALGNIPLNDMLDSAALQTASAEEIRALRTAFELPWNSWNLVRTWAAAVALVLVVLACVHQKMD